jgi:DNA-binding MarR family transcriptional regulator
VPRLVDDPNASPDPQQDTGDTHRGPDECASTTCQSPEADATNTCPTPDDVTDSCPSPQQLALLEQWNALQSSFRRLTDQLLRDVETETGLGPSSFQVLWFLLTTPGHSAPMNQLANTLNFTTAGTTNVADRLAGAGLLERRPAPADRRVTLAVLTDKGQQAATTAALTLADTLQARVIAPLGPDALAKLVDTVCSLAPDPRRRTGG